MVYLSNAMMKVWTHVNLCASNAPPLGDLSLTFVVEPPVVVQASAVYLAMVTLEGHRTTEDALGALLPAATSGTSSSCVREILASR